MIVLRPSNSGDAVHTSSEVNASARDFLLTLLGEFVLPGGGCVWTSTLVKAMGHLGVEPKTTRQALARAAKSAHLLEPERFGRRTKWSLTPRGKSVLEEGADRIYNFGIRQEPWDNTWLIVIASVPEADRHLRYRLRTRLAWVGFVPIGPGIWLTPWANHETEALQTLTAIGLEGSAFAFVGKPGAFGNSKERIHEAWDLAQLQDRYDKFIQQVASTASPQSDRDAFLSLTRVVHAWRQFPIADPGLPNILLPATWNGRQAAEAFRAFHKIWSPVAQRFWNDLAKPES